MPAKSKPADPAELVSEDAIRQRAYFMWEADGRPEGGHEHYWRLAHTEATKAFIEATTNGVARATTGKSAKAGKDKVKQAKAAKPKAVKAAAEAKPAAKKSTKPRAAVTAAKKAK